MAIVVALGLWAFSVPVAAFDWYSAPRFSDGPVAGHAWKGGFTPIYPAEVAELFPGLRKMSAISPPRLPGIPSNALVTACTADVASEPGSEVILVIGNPDPELDYHSGGYSDLAVVVLAAGSEEVLCGGGLESSSAVEVALFAIAARPGSPGQIFVRATWSGANAPWAMGWLLSVSDEDEQGVRLVAEATLDATNGVQLADVDDDGNVDILYTQEIGQDGHLPTAEWILFTRVLSLSAGRLVDRTHLFPKFGGASFEALVRTVQIEHTDGPATDDPELCYGLGLAYEWRGDSSQALRWYEEARKARAPTGVWGEELGGLDPPGFAARLMERIAHVAGAGGPIAGVVPRGHAPGAPWYLSGDYSLSVFGPSAGHFGVPGPLDAVPDEARAAAQEWLRSAGPDEKTALERRALASDGHVYRGANNVIIRDDGERYGSGLFRTAADGLTGEWPGPSCLDVSQIRPDGTGLLYAADAGTAKLYAFDVSTGDCLQRWAIPGWQAGSTQMYGLTVSADAKLAIVGSDGKLTAVDLSGPDSGLLWDFTEGDRDTDPDSGFYLATYEGDGPVMSWFVEPEVVLVAEMWSRKLLGFSRDGRLLGAIRNPVDSLVSLWDPLLLGDTMLLRAGNAVLVLERGRQGATIAPRTDQAGRLSVESSGELTATNETVVVHSPVDGTYAGPVVQFSAQAPPGAMVTVYFQIFAHETNEWVRRMASKRGQADEDGHVEFSLPIPRVARGTPTTLRYEIHASVAHRDGSSGPETVVSVIAEP